LKRSGGFNIPPPNWGVLIGNPRSRIYQGLRGRLEKGVGIGRGAPTRGPGGFFVQIFGGDIKGGRDPETGAHPALRTPVTKAGPGREPALGPPRGGTFISRLVCHPWCGLAWSNVQGAGPLGLRWFGGVRKAVAVGRILKLSRAKCG